jgi:flagellar assembly factor FliW
MQLKTTRFGLLALDDHRLVSFEDGIPGFPTFVQAALVEVDANPDFYWLQSVDDGDLAFLTVVPWSFFADFEIVLSDDDQAAIGLEDAGDAFICCLVSPDRDRGSFTANLRAPIVFNLRDGKGKQVILPDESLPLQAELG